MTSTKNTRTKSKSKSNNRKPIISLSMSETLLDKVNAEASDLGMDRSSFIALCISQYFRNLEAIDALKNSQQLALNVQKLQESLLEQQAKA